MMNDGIYLNLILVMDIMTITKILHGESRNRTEQERTSKLLVRKGNGTRGKGGVAGDHPHRSQDSPGGFTAVVFASVVDARHAATSPARNRKKFEEHHAATTHWRICGDSAVFVSQSSI
jgi:hypothetical protein